MFIFCIFYKMTGSFPPHIWSHFSPQRMYMGRQQKQTLVKNVQFFIFCLLPLHGDCEPTFSHIGTWNEATCLPKILKKSGSRSQTSKCSLGRKNGRRESNFGYVVGNLLLFKKVAASYTKIFNRFRDIRPGTHHGISVAFWQHGTLMG